MFLKSDISVYYPSSKLVALADPEDSLILLFSYDASTKLIRF